MKDLLDYIRFNEHHFPVSPELAHSYMQRVSDGYDKMQQCKIVIAGLARNVGSILPATMLRMELLGRTFSDYRILIYENDSIDRTVEILAEWTKLNPHVEIVTESLGAPPSRPIRCSNRADRMAIYRGRCQDRIREKYANADYVALIDTDVAGGWSPDGVASTFGHDGWDFVGSNGLIYKRNGWNVNATAHYDAWAYRTDEDFSPLTTKYVNRLQFARGQPMIPLPSCFGGLGFYRMDAYLAGTYEGGDIEHVSMHRSMRDRGYGKTFLNPSQIVVYGRKQRRLDGCVKRTQSLARALWLHRNIPWRFEKPMKFEQLEPHFRTGCLVDFDKQREPAAA